MQFDRIGIAVEDLSVVYWTKTFSDWIDDVQFQLGPAANGPCYELIAPISARSPVRWALRSGDYVTNHVAYIVSEHFRRWEKTGSGELPADSAPKPTIAYESRPSPMAESKSSFYVADRLAIRVDLRAESRIWLPDPDNGSAITS